MQVQSAQAKERPTLKTIAFMTGLGITTVSRALKDAPDIGAETSSGFAWWRANWAISQTAQACGYAQAKPSNCPCAEH